MSQQARKDTDPELRLRQALHALGLRYRLHVRVPGRPRRTIDVAFTRIRFAVFIDGCFWHGCPQHATAPKSNADWWATKLEANRTRDADVTAHLEAQGWTVMRFWEHENPADAVARITSQLARSQSSR